MNRTVKRGGMLLGAVLLAAAITACGTNSGKETASPAPSASPSASPSAPAGPEQPKQRTGTFTGLADSHTAEIVTDGEPYAYQFGEELLEAVSGFHKGDPVSIEYVENNLEGGGIQLVLTKIEKSGEGASGGSGGGATGNPAPLDLPAEKELVLELEGMKETKTARLVQGDGFALYSFDLFAFDETHRVLSMKVDEDYYARIEKLPDGYNLEEVKAAAADELAKVGKVREMPVEEINPMLGGAKLMLIASNDMLTQEVIIKEVGGAGYRIDVNMPTGEASEGFGPHLFVSLSTLVNLESS